MQTLDNDYESWFETNRDILMQEYLESFEDFVEDRFAEYQRNICINTDEFELADLENDERKCIEFENSLNNNYEE